MIEMICACFIGLVAGFWLCYSFLDIKSSGEIVMQDDAMYLNINKNNANNFKNGMFVTLKIKRRNFSGFNEDM